MNGTTTATRQAAAVGVEQTATPVWAGPHFVFSAIVTYCVVHLIVRLSMVDTLGIDDAEQALFAQDFSWSYRRSAPPLFTWILIALGKLLGVNILSISLIRYALLAVIFGFAYATARRLIADPRLSALAVYSFAAIYLFAFYSHHDLTHTTMMTAMVGVAWYAFVRLAETPRLGWYLALGGVCGLGLLGKWNFVMFAAALPLACLLHPDYRRLVLTWKIVPAALLCGAIVLPTVVAALHGPAGLDTAASVLGGDEAPYLRRIAEGTVRLIVSVIAYPQPLLVLMAFTFAKPLLRGMRAESTATPASRPVPSAAFLAITVAVSLGLHLLLVVTVGAREFHERLMQPPLFILPVLLFMLIERGHPSARATNTFAIFVALLVPVALAARIVAYQIGADYCGSCRNMVPFERLAGGLKAAGFSGIGTIVADGFHIGGNMRVEFPDARIIDAGYPPETWPSASGNDDCMLLWQDRDGRRGESAPRLQAYVVDKLDGVRDAVPRTGKVAEPMYHSARQYRLAYLLYPATGECR